MNPSQQKKAQNTQSTPGNPDTDSDHAAQNRSQLFQYLRSALKAQGYTYRDIAEKIDTSELTVKRLFRDQDCKMSRLLALCDMAGLSLSDLTEMQARNYANAQYLPRETEQLLAEQPTLFSFLMLLVSQLDLDTIVREYDLSHSTLYQKLRQLEKLNIIELLPNNQFKYTVSLPIRLRHNGPLSELIKRPNLYYISHCIDRENDPDYEFSTNSRLMTESSARKIQDQLRQTLRDFHYLATQDQLFYKPAELKPYKLIHAMGPFPVLEMFPLE